MGKRGSDLAAGTLSVEQVSQAYVLNREALVRRATRRIANRAVAEEIVQEAFLKVILASPELETYEHLLAYLNTTVNNLCISYARAKGIRPQLLAIDADMSAQEIDAIIESSDTTFDDELMRAEDSAIVREAIARLSPADRAVLLAEAYEGLTPPEIAQEYGMTVESVHVAISRARKNLRTILETWIVDEVSGMTAAQFLSNTYAKAKENSKKVGAVVLSLTLLIAAFLGLWDKPTTHSDFSMPKMKTLSPHTPRPHVAVKPMRTGPTTASQKMKIWALNYLSKTGPLDWPGLDSNGIPVGYTVNNGAGLNGIALITQDPFVMDPKAGTVSTQSCFTTFQDGINVILHQTVVNTLGKITYSSNPIVRIGGSWVALEIESMSTDVKKLDNGLYLITSFMVVDINKSALNAPIAGGSLGGADIPHIPAVIATRLLTTSIGSPVSGQAVEVLDPLNGRS